MKGFLSLVLFILIGCVNSVYGWSQAYPYRHYPPGSFVVIGTVYVQAIPGMTYLFAGTEHEAVRHNAETIEAHCLESGYDCSSAIESTLESEHPTCQIYDLSDNLIAELHEETYVTLPKFAKITCTTASSKEMAVFIAVKDFDFQHFLTFLYPSFGVSYPVDTQWSYSLPEGPTWIDNILVATGENGYAVYWVPTGSYTTQELTRLEDHTYWTTEYGLVATGRNTVIFNGNHYIGEDAQ